MKIFAIVPVYNVEPYITEFLSSLSMQNSDNVTFILVNDGSTDRSGEICRSYVEKDSRFQLIEQENSGVSAARNAGLEYVERIASAGDYILFFDPDDYLTSNNAICEISENLTSECPDILMYNYNINNVLTSNNIRRGGVMGSTEIGKILYPWILFGEKHEGTVLTASLFRSAFSAEIIKRNHLRFRTDIRKAEDTLFYARYLTLIDNAMLSTITPYNYRIRPQSLTTTYRKPSQLGIEKGLSILAEFRQCAEGCQGISATAVDNYFSKRYIKLIINHVIGLTDRRSNLKRPEIKAEVKDLYSNAILLHNINRIIPFTGDSLLEKIESYLVKKRFGLISYGNFFNLLKHIKFKLR